MRAFLLGQLAEAEVAAIEETAFDDPASFEELRTVEDELFDLGVERETVFLLRYTPYEALHLLVSKLQIREQVQPLKRA